MTLGGAASAYGYQGTRVPGYSYRSVAIPKDLPFCRENERSRSRVTPPFQVAWIGVDLIQENLI